MVASIRWSRVSSLLLLVVAGCAEKRSADSAALAGPGDVIARARLGNNTEGLTFIDRGPMANHAIVVDGGEVIAIDTTGRRAAPGRLFHTADLGLVAPPRGIGFASAEQHLVFNDLFDHGRLLFADLDGVLVEELEIIYPAGFVPDHVEGIQVLRSGDIAMVVWRFGASTEVRIEIIDRGSGAVTDEIVVDPSIAANGITALARDGDSFLVSPVNREVYRVGLDGAVLEGPLEVDELRSIEGLAAARGGFYAAGYGAGRLIALGRQLQRRPGKDRDYPVGFGFSRLNGVAWDNDSGSLRVGAQITDTASIAAVPADLASLEVVASLEPFNGVMTDVGNIDSDDLLLASTAFAPNGILFFDDAGDVVGDIDFGGQPAVRVAHVAATDELAVVLLPDLAQLHLFDRDGAPTRTIDLAPIGVTAIAGVDAEGAELIVADGSGVVFETDLDGVLVDSADYRPILGDGFGIAGMAAMPGALAFTEGETNEVLVVGRL